MPEKEEKFCACPDCHGRGRERPRDRALCTTCGGLGDIPVLVRRAAPEKLQDTFDPDAVRALCDAAQGAVIALRLSKAPDTAAELESYIQRVRNSEHKL